jgi:DNA mismatch repair protein MutL
VASIRRLPSSLVNQIAAGEVIACPSAAVKELVENALDAQATCVEVYLEDGGKSAIIVKDNGVGMSSEDLALCVERHATSKLQDLARIATFGFRGEALAALGAVCRMTVASRERGEKEAFCIKVEGGGIFSPEPTALKEGTHVEAQDLFFATPARLKFLKSTAAESGHCVDAVKRLALAHPDVTFRLSEGGRSVFSYAKSDRKTRIIEVLGGVSVDDLLSIEDTHDIFHIAGFIGKSTVTQATSSKQFFFVNGRAVRDVCFSTALRAAFQELIARDRHPMAVLFLTMPLEDVDVNVHPAKTEVRFRDTRRVQQFLRRALSKALCKTETPCSTFSLPEEKDFQQKEETSTSLSSLQRVLGISHRSTQLTHGPYKKSSQDNYLAINSSPEEPFHLAENCTSFGKTFPLKDKSENDEEIPLLALRDGMQSPLLNVSPLPLGRAKVQLHKRYIIAEAAEAIVIVDQHAAHERIIYEKIKKEFKTTGVAQQTLLMPVTMTFAPDCIALFKEHQEEFCKLGLHYEVPEREELIVHTLPAFMKGADPKPLLEDLAEELKAWGKGFALIEKFHDVFATFACHTSIRSGRILSLLEMDGLLRTIEKTENASQCNHGRPTYIKVSLTEFDKLFERS